jgi:monoamine oxidase
LRRKSRTKDSLSQRKDLEMNAESTEIFDVIIVGAGLAGLSAGYYILKSNPNLKILILEAKHRVGGRTETMELSCSKDGMKKKWDVGGQWVKIEFNSMKS